MVWGRMRKAREGKTDVGKAENQRRMEGSIGLKKSARKVDERRNDGKVWRRERIMGKGRICNRGGEKRMIAVKRGKEFRHFNTKQRQEKK